MTKVRLRIVATMLCVGVTGLALAQIDASSWPTFKANGERTGSVTAPGPATQHAWTMGTSLIGSVSSGGIATAANGDLYYKSTENGNRVYRIDSATGALLARSPNFGGNTGDYAGVTVGADKVYTATNGAPSRILVLNKETLAIEAEWDGGGALISVRGAPLISTVLNQNGHYTLYVSDRSGRAIHALDATTGDLLWTHLVLYESILGKLGPMWVTGNGKQAIAHFGNSGNPTVTPGGEAIEDNGDGTYNLLWDQAGPMSFNWWGSGALSGDGTRIYVTTFNDGDVPSLWAIDITDGSIIWSVPGFRGDPNLERNFFARPSVVGNRIYCGGGRGVVACFVDEGATWRQAWEYRDGLGEHTAISVVTDPDTDDTYVNTCKQGNMGFAVAMVLRDDGDDFTVMARHFKKDGPPDWTFPIRASQIVPEPYPAGNGTGEVMLDAGTNELSWNIVFADMSSDVTAAHFHGPADIGETAGPQVDIGAISGLVSPMIGSTFITQQQADDLMAGLWYVNIHTVNNSGGEIRGQVIHPLLKPSIFGGNACTVGADGGLYIGSGLRDGQPGEIYKFAVGGCQFDPCDTNCDGEVNAFDVESFVDVLFGGDQCEPNCSGDTNGDGVVNAFDIDGFLACLFP